ncbi:MAG TPA: pantoate--beta-alanine ligase [Bacteroidales bacterium]|nr:pantoate--beta-alanine ligase [Bacteroidales bacterium]
MRVLSHIRDLQKVLRKERGEGRSVGFVPTMGALHEGHLSIIRRSRAENGLTLCSIFVNPIQFNNPRDLEKYPRSLKQDLALLEKEGCDLVFTPEAEEIYPGGKAESPPVDFGYLDRILEGKYRPGHFKGVATVVKRFFDIIGPDRSYFGKKDYQQLLIVKKMVDALKIPVEIVPCPIVREPDGLAMSSRNLRLTIGERKAAPFIYEVLREVKDKAGELAVGELKELALNRFSGRPEFRAEYFEIADAETLLPVGQIGNEVKAIACLAVFLGEVRLIDNMELFV